MNENEIPQKQWLLDLAEAGLEERHVIHIAIRFQEFEEEARKISDRLSEFVRKMKEVEDAKAKRV
jgi:hypothetical protein